jgi:hypothetical protein
VQAVDPSVHRIVGHSDDRRMARGETGTEAIDEAVVSFGTES